MELSNCFFRLMLSKIIFTKMSPYCRLKDQQKLLLELCEGICDDTFNLSDVRQHLWRIFGYEEEFEEEASIIRFPADSQLIHIDSSQITQSNSENSHSSDVHSARECSSTIQPGSADYNQESESSHYVNSMMQSNSSRKYIPIDSEKIGTMITNRIKEHPLLTYFILKQLYLTAKYLAKKKGTLQHIV